MKIGTKKRKKRADISMDYNNCSSSGNHAIIMAFTIQSPISG